jgi:carbon storage regulator CsrA
MLILTRKSGESLMINDNVKVKALAIVGNQVRISERADLAELSKKSAA